MADWFESWVDTYSTLFGIKDRLELATMASWRRVFESIDATAAEMESAGVWLAANLWELSASEARFAGKMPAHLDAIIRRIRSSRAAEYRQQTATKERDLGTCTVCGGTGFVVVPHVAGVRNGAWVQVKVARGGQSYYTQAVYCSCSLGRWKADRMLAEWDSRKHHERAPLTLDSYEVRNTNWRAQMAQRQEELSALAGLSSDDGWAAAIRAVMERVHGPGG